MAKAKRNARSQSADSPEAQKTVVHISREHWYLLKSVALRRSLKKGARVTLGEVLSEAIERQRKTLEKELG